jgi:hypothetical protein
VSPPTTPPSPVNTPLLQGTATGSYVIARSSNTAGFSLSLNGKGQVGILGSVQLSGSIPFNTSGQSAPSGSLTLTDNKGSIQLTLTSDGGDQTLGPVSANAHSYKYTIVHGTGAFANLHGSGTLSLTLKGGGTGISPGSGPTGTTPVPPPVGGPTFLKGQFVIKFDEGASNLPPPL